MTQLRISHISHLLLGIMLMFTQTLWALGTEKKHSPAEKQPQLEFSLYPNPLDQQDPLFVECPNDSPREIVVYNVMGEVVYQHITQETGIYLDRLETGIYLVQVTQDQKTGIQRLVVK